VIRLHCFLLAAKQPTTAGDQRSSGVDDPAPAGHAASLANGVTAAAPCVRTLWRVPGTASVDLRSCSLNTAELTVQPEKEATAAEDAKHGAAVPPAPLLLSVRWRRGAPRSDGALARCQLRSKLPLLAAYVRSLEDMAEGGSEARAHP